MKRLTAGLLAAAALCAAAAALAQSTTPQDIQGRPAEDVMHRAHPPAAHAAAGRTYRPAGAAQRVRYFCQTRGDHRDCRIVRSQE